MSRFHPRQARTALPLLVLLLALPSGSGSALDWPSFRGRGDSHSQATDLPLEWTSESVRWKAPLPGKGQSSPVLWKDRLFTTSTEGSMKEELHVLCHDLQSGKELWRVKLANSYPEELSNYISCAAPTPVAEQDRLYVLFEGGDLAALDHGGTILWQRDLSDSYGPFTGNHGQGASPVASSAGVVVVKDHKGDSFIATLDRRTGNTLWKTARNTSSSWASPIVRTAADGAEEIVCSASSTVTAYDAATGEVRWHFDSIEGNNVPSATLNGKYLALGSRERDNSMVLRIEEGEPVVHWIAKEATCSFGSPLIHESRVYYVNRAGVLFCYDLESGQLLFDHRLPGSTWASPLAAEGRIWFFGSAGGVQVLEPADEAKVISEPSLEVPAGDRIYGYAVANGCFVFRTGSELVCVAR